MHEKDIFEEDMTVECNEVYAGSQSVGINNEALEVTIIKKRTILCCLHINMS